MEIFVEPRAFYPAMFDPTKDKCKGSLHVTIRIGDIAFDLRNVLVFKNGDFFMVRLPFRAGQREGKTVNYPIFSLNDEPLHKKLINEIKEKGIPFVENFFRLNPMPITEVKNRRDNQGRHDQGNVVKEALNKPNPIVFSTKSPTASKPKVFVDLPPRKPPVRKSAPNPFRTSRY